MTYIDMMALCYPYYFPILGKCRIIFSSHIRKYSFFETIEIGKNSLF